MPVVMVSSLTERGGEITLRALELGAIDFVTKPKLGIGDGLLEYTEIIADKIRAASRAKLRAGARAAAAPAPALRRPLSSSEKLVIVGRPRAAPKRSARCSSPAAGQPGDPDHAAHAGRLHAVLRPAPGRAVRGDGARSRAWRTGPARPRLSGPGGDTHMRLGRSGANYVIELDASEPVNRHRPSVDVLFNSAAVAAGKNAIGVILTGMGRMAPRACSPCAAPAPTIAQDEASCVVFGMPREAIAIGAAEEVVSLSAMSERILTRLGDRGHRV